jgi:hypothetical protein
LHFADKEILIKQKKDAIVPGKEVVKDESMCHGD